MKKTLFSILLSTSIIGVNYAQNTNLDRNYVNFQYVNLPSRPIEDSNLRTYFVDSNLDAINKSNFANKMVLAGFQKKENPDDASLNILLSLDKINIRNIDVSEQRHEREGKDGQKEIIYEYTPYISYGTKANLRINSKINEGTSFTYGRDLNNYYGPSNYNYSKAKEYIELNYQRIVNDIQEKFISETINSSAHVVNNYYAYPTYNENINFWILASKKHPEYENHQNIFTQIKSLVLKIKAHESLEPLKNELTPIETYLLDVLSKYPDDKKPHKKMRYATYYNLAQLYLIFDMPEKAIEMGDKIIANDYDTRDGKKFKEEAEKLIHLMNINHTKTRHFSVK